ncbi:MAG TPA: CHASE2 and HATPase_c domain-containing protein [Bdellovibrionales bacterium]|nr:CHASE2 and HATPase_c domain-containing protein [Bdellovibrionales bacterium]
MSVNWLESWLHNKWVHHSLKFAFAFIITVILAPFQLDVIEYMAYDLRMLLSPRPAVSGNVVLLSIEYDTLKKLKRDPEALDWAVVLQKLQQAAPMQVVSFVNPSQIQGSYEDLTTLAEIAGRLPFMYGDNDLPKTGATKLDPLAAPFELIPIVSAPVTTDRTMFAKDGVTRRLILSYENQFMVHGDLAKRFNGLARSEDYKGAFELLDSKQMMIRYRAKGAYPQLKFIDVLEGNIDPETVRGKIILIGRDTLEAAADYVTTPLSKDLLALSRLEMHANILDTMILNQAPRFSPRWVLFILTFLVSLLTIYVVLGARPTQGLAVLGASVMTFLVLSLVLFAGLSFMIPVAHPLVAVFICYYFVIPYRLIIENRRSWEYYQKNRLLTQVEELKSNFMRMMSHDLKTPLARIQGMTEILQNESLTQSQSKALNTIQESSHELTEFIGSILSLSRIESKEMKLQLKSRDVNGMVLDVIRKHEYMAKRKDIELVTELEPLFSIRVDEGLINTVLANLIENAIKYAPNGTKVLVSTEEVNNEVVIQVADQGRGIPREDLPRVFDRFYRAKNSRTVTAGNGLGLYLAKYFVELHNGRIDVESQIDKGSTFTVRLPMNLNLEPDLLDQGGLHV